MTVTHPPLFFAQQRADLEPVERALVHSIAERIPAETYLGIAFYRPDGGCRTWHAWTDGGHIVGEQVDGRALAAGLDAADWLHIGDRHSTVTFRGRIRIEAYPLRPILADVQAGERSPEERRLGLRSVIECAAAQTGQTARPGIPRWIGFGPTLLIRKDINA